MKTSAADDSSVSQSVFAIMEKENLLVESTYYSTFTFKALVGAFFVIVHLYNFAD